MRRLAVLLGALLGALLALAGCGSHGDHIPNRAGPFVVSGSVVLTGGTGEHAVLALTHDNRCYGVGPNTAFAIDAPLTVQVGDHHFTTRLGPGDIIAPGNGQVVTGCRFPFAIADVTSSTSKYTMTVAGVHRTFSRQDLAAPITVQVPGKPID